LYEGDDDWLAKRAEIDLEELSEEERESVEPVCNVYLDDRV